MYHVLRFTQYVSSYLLYEVFDILHDIQRIVILFMLCLIVLLSILYHIIILDHHPCAPTLRRSIKDHMVAVQNHSGQGFIRSPDRVIQRPRLQDPGRVIRRPKKVSKTKQNQAFLRWGEICWNI